ncbi:hypothetical protein CAPTEDRAFT_225898 [Capitella teleta]|uniref:Uncharacterized protein n=1 Tax=Capitella teleta TaxID=283909 RepID=R7VGP6_CAPTE|nr:hypothetical protein CAPTEDRAFT_225898 [Capitella teleta]|eukprot:ELU14865.1 hypothetical protein CAPTEDRAFT_225898 [Capitella teleta]
MATKETLYCICRRSYEEEQFMIECDKCKDWFHGSCVGIHEHQASDIETYHCPNCQPVYGPLVLKKRRNVHRHDYSETDDRGIKAVQTGTAMFLQELKNRAFAPADHIPIGRLKGHEVCIEYLEEQGGFTVPILVDRTDGLDLKLPPPTFSIQDVENHVGSMREIDVIDVAKQEDYKMLMREWTEYYNSPNRNKIFNVISLEFSNTKLADLVEPPRIVKELSWVSNFWPSESPSEEPMFCRPEVQRYCLMGVKDSFTDFHIDFGGTSVWYHVLRGEKVFYMIRPTPANLTLYERWLSSSNQSELFFGDQVDVCYKCTIRQGQTVFIPTGWIHAVLTPIDSLVFGGNFLHSFNIDLQIQIYQIEKRCETSSKYLFPNYETLHWYAAKYVLDFLKDYNEDGKIAPVYLISGAKALVTSLKSWTHRKDHVKNSVPETIQYGRLLKELQKEIRRMTGSPVRAEIPQKAKKKEKNKKKVKKGGGVGGGGGGGKEEAAEKVDDKQPPPFRIKIPRNTQQLHKTDDDLDDLKVTLKVKGLLGSQSSLSHDECCDDDEKRRLKFKVEKEESVDVSGSIYDFRDSDEEFNPMKKEKKDPEEEAKHLGEESGLKLRVSQGQIINHLSNRRAPSVRGSFDVHGAAIPGVHSGSSEDEAEQQGLVVDDPKGNSTLKPGSLRMKLSSTMLFKGVILVICNFYAVVRSEAEGKSSEKSGSIADILEASGYGADDFKLADGQASPSMRDAIGGLLSMSCLGANSSSSSLSAAERAKVAQQKNRKVLYSKETCERMPTCFKDEEYVYPTLDVSDNEADHVFKPRGRLKKDETWNPKAKLTPNCPKMERPARDNARRESVESGLAAAAAKLADKPRPKRQYIRKKPRDERRSSVVSDDGSPDGSSLTIDTGEGTSKRPGAAPSSTCKSKKPRKGMATAKQRLGKILKIHKFTF